VPVVATGTKTDRDVERHKPIAVTVVTLLVRPEEAERLTLASTEGKIQLALRNPLDSSTPPTPGVKPAGLLGGQATTPKGIAVTRLVSVPRPAGAPDLPTIEIIRGDKRAR